MFFRGSHGGNKGTTQTWQTAIQAYAWSMKISKRMPKLAQIGIYWTTPNFSNAFYREIVPVLGKTCSTTRKFPEL